MSKQAKAKKGEINNTPERHFGVVLENIDSKLDLVVEGHQALDKKIDSNHQEFQEFRKEVDYKFEVVFEKFDEVDKRFEQVDRRFEQIDRRFEQIDRRFDEVAGEIRIVRHELKEKIGRDEFILLEKRVAILEKSKR